MAARVGVLTVVVVAAVLTAGPAAAESKFAGVDDNDWNGSINLVDENQLQVPVCVSQDNVGLLGIALPILSPQFMGDCAITVEQEERDRQGPPPR